MITLTMCAYLFRKLIATVVILYLVTLAYSEAQMQEIIATLIQNKAVATSYATIQPYSKAQCVNKCFDQSRQGRCKSAGYNKATQSCQLSDDMQHQVLNSTDEAAEVFILPQGNCVFFMFKWHS